MRRIILMVAVVAVTLVVASGVAWAATIVGTGGNDTRRGTETNDSMYGLGGNDTLAPMHNCKTTDAFEFSVLLNGDGEGRLVLTKA